MFFKALSLKKLYKIILKKTSQLLVLREVIARKSRDMHMLENAVSLVVGVGIGCVGWLFYSKLSKGSGTTSNSSRETNGPKIATDGEYKMILVVRNDLKMGKGKAAAQCAHAAVGCCEEALQKNQEVLAYWRRHGQPKVVVKVEDEKSLIALYKKSQSVGLITCIIQDAGRTQIAPGSKTVLGVGPGPASLVNEVTGHLKLY